MESKSGGSVQILSQLPPRAWGLKLLYCKYSRCDILPQDYLSAHTGLAFITGPMEATLSVF
jgi:hypothetical protein